MAGIAPLCLSCLLSFPLDATPVPTVAPEHPEIPAPSTSASAFLQNTNSQENLPIAIPTYIPATILKKSKMRYPRDARLRNQEGAVQLHYMIDPEGKPYEIEATSYFGDKTFIGAAKRAARWTRYQPANFNGKPIHSGAAVTFHFAFSRPIKGASRRFIRKYRALQEAIAADDAEQIKAKYEALNALEFSSHYEYAYQNLARAQLYQRDNNPLQALNALSIATREGDFFKKEYYQGLLRQRFWLETATGKFARALQTWLLIEPLLEEGSPKRKLYEQAIEKIVNIKHSDQTLLAHGLIQEHYRYSHKLLKTSFSFVEVEGNLAESKLYCDKGFLGFPIDPKIRYHVRNDYKDCTLIVIGDPGTTFKLIEQ